jgi:hypothetical protein
MLLSFPFLIRGFHSDNGSEYINRHVAELLNKLLSEEHTKSRSRNSNDNAQAESKNGSIVRKHFGYSHIPQRFARVVNDFCRDQLSPYIDFHRPCLFPETIADAKGRQRKRYPYKLMMTPYEKLKSLTQAEQYLKPGVRFQDLDALAASISDNDSARRLNEARARLFKSFFQSIDYQLPETPESPSLRLKLGLENTVMKQVMSSCIILHIPRVQELPCLHASAPAPPLAMYAPRSSGRPSAAFSGTGSSRRRWTTSLATRAYPVRACTGTSPTARNSFSRC